MVDHPTPASGRTGNVLLDALPPDDLDAVLGFLEEVDLPFRAELERPGEPVTHATFLTSGIASRVALAAEHRVEVGIVGREGMTGMPIFLGTGSSPHRLFMQVEGAGLRADAETLLRLTEAHPALRGVLLRWTHVVVVQTAQTALANTQHTVEERLARWLLMCQDRTGSPFLQTTHEFLSLMLGVRRAGVTLATHSLEGAKLIRSERGRITVLNREGLLEVAGDCYGVAEAEARRLFGEPPG